MVQWSEYWTGPRAEGHECVSRHPSQTFTMSSHAGDKLDTLIKFTLQNISDEGFIGSFAKKYGFLGIPVGLAVILIIALACSAGGTGKK